MPTFDVGLRKGLTRFRLHRPAWLSPEVTSWIAGVIDFSLILMGAATAFAYSGITDQPVIDPGRYVLSSFLAATLFVGLFERIGGYRVKQLSQLRWQLSRTLVVWGFTVSALVFIAFFTKTSESYSRGWIIIWIVFALNVLLIRRYLVHAAITRWASGSYLARNVVIIGGGDEGHRLIVRLQRELDKTVIIRGVFDDRKSRLPDSVAGVPLLGTTDDLLCFARRVPIDEIIVALPLHAPDRVNSLCEKMKALPVDVRLSVEPLAEAFGARNISLIGGIPVLEISDRPLKNWRTSVRLNRSFDGINRNIDKA
jgi:FlaA1/EpsC-like NDP-sugar epimerase